METFSLESYKSWIKALKEKVRSAQIKASIAVNTALIDFYWDFGKMIAEKENVWGAKLIEQIAKDLCEEFPNMQGLSRRNLFNAKKFYQFYGNQLVQQVVALIGEQPLQNQNNTLIQQSVGQIPWGITYRFLQNQKT